MPAERAVSRSAGNPRVAKGVFTSRYLQYLGLELVADPDAKVYAQYLSVDLVRQGRA